MIGHVKKTTISNRFTTTALIAGVLVGGCDELIVQKKEYPEIIIEPTPPPVVRVEKPQEQPKPVVVAEQPKPVVQPKQYEINPDLSPEQQETMRRLLEKLEISRIVNNCLSFRVNQPIRQIMADIAKDIDPVLVGKHVVFSNEWKKMIGNDKVNQVTRQEFQKWVGVIDKVYECYAEFTGNEPTIGASFIDLHYIKTEGNVKSSLGGHARGGTGFVCVRENHAAFKGDFLTHVRQGNPMFIIMHEMAHSFDGVGPRSAESETLAHFIQAYAMLPFPRIFRNWSLQGVAF